MAPILVSYHHINYLFAQFAGINLSIKVLQAGAWPLGPTQQTIPFAIPQEFEKSIRMFESFYHDNFNGRKLTWLHYLCQGELKISYLKKTYIITMQTYQMAILLLFENVDVMTCKEIQVSYFTCLLSLWFNPIANLIDFIFSGNVGSKCRDLPKTHAKFDRIEIIVGKF